MNQFKTRVRRSWLKPLLLGLAIAALLPAHQAQAHRSGCHRWHTCPSDRGTYQMVPRTGSYSGESVDPSPSYSPAPSYSPEPYDSPSPNPVESIAPTLLESSDTSIESPSPVEPSEPLTEPTPTEPSEPLTETSFTEFDAFLIGATAVIILGLCSGLIWKLSQPPDILDEYYTEILDEHFRCQKLIYQHYKYRKTDSLALDKAVNACQQQILIAPQAVYAFKHKTRKPLPTHLGFEQLASIYEKQKNYAEAIRISKAALSQGWSGNWEKQIARCQKRLSKQSQRDRFSLAWLQITASKTTSRKSYPIQNSKSKIQN